MPMSIAPLPRDMAAENRAPVLDWARRILADNGGGDLEIVYHLEPGYNLEVIQAMTDLVSGQPDFVAV